MNWLDVTLVLMMVVSIVAGLYAGFAKAGIGFLASVLGLVLGRWGRGRSGRCGAA